MSDRVLVVGATSGIARALCQILAKRGCRLLLAARDLDETTRLAADLRVRYQASVDVELFDALNFAEHPTFFERCLQLAEDDLTGLVICHGSLPDQAITQTDFAAARQAIDVNFTSVVSLLNLAANYLEPRQRGFLVAISSVAGDRGRQSNYTYGSAKGALSIYLQGLRNRLHPAGVQVLTVKPGFVDTPMTHGLLNPQSPLVAAPERVARDIDRAIRKRRDVLYTPWFWWFIMSIIRGIPESIFKRLKL